MRADGRTIWVRGITKVDFDEAGDIVRFIGSIQDVTESKRAEQALRDSETLLREAQRRARLAYWLWDPETKRYLLAAEAAEILGLPVADLSTNDHFLPYVHEDDRAWVAEAYLGQTERLEPCVLEYRWRRPDGKIIWLRDMCERENDPGGRVRRLVGTIQDVTEQKRSEEALRENQALLLAAQRRARIAYWLEDAGPGRDYRDYIASDFMAEVLGLPADAVPRTDGDHVKIVHPQDRATVAHAYERAVTGKVPYAIEYRIFRPDGSIGWLRELAEFQAAPAGRPGRLIGTIQDITEQKSIETALRDSEARLRAFMDHAPVGMFVKELDGRFAMLNRHDAEFFGLQPEDIVGRHSADFLASDDAAIVEAHDRSVLAAGAPVGRELHFANRPRIEWSYEVKFPIRDAGGAVVAIGGVAVDISALKRAEQALRDSEARMRAFMDHAPMLIYLKDIEGRYQLVNREFERVEGVSEDDLRGKTVFDVLPREHAELFAASDREILALGQMVARENHDPARVAYRDSLAVRFPVRDGSGNVVGIGGFTQDITERKRAENALRESEARLRRAQLQAKLACWSWDLAADSYVWAPGSGLALGLSDAALPVGNADYNALIHPEDRAALWRLYAEVEAGRDAFTAEFRIQRSDGEIIWVEEIGEVERDDGGRRASVNGTLQDVTERKRAEAALRESEARLRGFLDHAPFAMYLKDTDLRYQLVNRAVEQFQGMTAAEICGRTPGEIYPPALAERFMAEDHEVLARGVPVMFEYSDPTMSSYADSATVRFPVRDSSGRIVAIGGITQDITERKQAERALRESEARMRSFMDNAPVAMAVKDLERRFVMANRHVTVPYGRTTDDVIGKRTIDIASSEGAKAIDALEREVIASGQTVTAEVHFAERSVSPWTFEVKFPIRDANGNLYAIGGIAMDTTVTKRSERALRESEARLRSFMDNAPVLVAIKDLDRRFVMVNSRVEHAFGRPAQDLIGRRTIELSESDGAKSVDALEREVIASGSTATAEIFFADRRGAPWAFEVKFPIRDASGRMTAIGGVAMDISDRKKAELALAESEARFRSFMDNAPFDMVVKDLRRAAI